MVDLKKVMQDANAKVQELRQNTPEAKVANWMKEQADKMQSSTVQYKDSKNKVKDFGANTVKNAGSLILNTGAMFVDPQGFVDDLSQAGKSAVDYGKRKIEQYKQNPEDIKKDIAKIPDKAGDYIYTHGADVALIGSGVAGGAKGVTNVMNKGNIVKGGVKAPTTQVQNASGLNIKTNPNYPKVIEPKPTPKVKYTEITPEQALQELQPEASLNEALNQAENYANIKNAVDSIEVPEPNYLVDMNKVNVPKISNSSVYEYLSEYAPEVFTAKDYAPYATSEIIESYARAMGIPKEQAVRIFKAQSGLSRYLDNAAGRTYLNDGNASVDILHPDEWVWGRNLRGATYEGTNELPTLTSTVNHEFTHKKLLDLYDQLEKGTITQEGYNELINLNALTQKGAYTESIPHAVDSIPIEGNISIPEGRVQKYNQIQPYSEFSNEAFKDYRESFGKTLQQRAIRNAVGLGDKEFEKSVDSVLNRLGVDRYGNLNWGNK